MNEKIVVTQLVIETQSPMAINTGRRDTGFDTELARDINGLPMIPATAIAGVWRHLAKSQACGDGQHIEDLWFGTTEQASSLVISNGVLLNSHSELVDNYTEPSHMESDPLLALCLAERPHHRDGVAVNDRGVAIDRAKFDQIVLPKGLRFSITLQWSNQDREDEQQLDDEQWHQLLALWEHPTFALGANTRNGLGRVKIIASEEHQILLHRNLDAGKQLNLARASRPPKSHALKTCINSGAVNRYPSWSISLKALDNWRCGRGVELLSKPNKSLNHSVNVITYSEPVVIWKGTQAEIIPFCPVVCGSSIKGMLAHRIAFHYRKHAKQWAETAGDAENEIWQKRPEALKALLGYADNDHDQSVAGSLWVEDADIEYEHIVIRHHNSIDRFTGGVRKGALYSEELLYQPRFTISMYLTKQEEDLEALLLCALNDTIRDVEQGLLPMGAGSGRGTSLVIKNEKGTAK